ncbi:MAG TPA: hypothetical protein PLT85_16835, partial [Thauera aminoaromatica]|nr:hypothetical protein [Thauera aminoaromatica]
MALDHERLLALSAPAMEDLHRQLDSPTITVLLADSAGSVLRAIGSRALPAAPGEPVLLEDLDSDIHTSCSGDGQVKEGDGTVVKAGEKPPPFPQAQRLGDLSVEQHGRQKLAVPLPSLGGVAILDAQ